jgi:hypothetical protein
VLLYESAEGGAGVLNRLATDSQLVRAVATEALRVMHFDLPDGKPLPESPADLVDAPGTQCVAGCYRCLLSYYNQPDHPEIDRQDMAAKTYLLALARASLSLAASSGTERVGGSLTESSPHRVLSCCETHGLPAPRSVVLGGQSAWVWNAHTAALVEGDLTDDAREAATARGLDVTVIALTASDDELLEVLRKMLEIE